MKQGWLLYAFIGAAVCGPPAASADVIWTEVPNSLTTNSFWHNRFPDRSGAFIYNPSGDDSVSIHGPLSIDLNNDGIEDFRFAGRPSSIRLECAEGNAAWCWPPQGVSSLSRLFPLEKGNLVGETVTGYTEETGQWRSEQILVNGYALSLTAPPAPQIIPSGFYQFGTEAFAGLRFQVGTNTHYGGVYIEDIDPGPGANPLGAAFVVRFAYEDQPDTPVEIIPEPGSVVMWLGGAGLLTLYRRERARCRKHPDDVR